MQVNVCATPTTEKIMHEYFSERVLTTFTPQKSVQITLNNLVEQFISSDTLVSQSYDFEIYDVETDPGFAFEQSVLIGKNKFFIFRHENAFTYQLMNDSGLVFNVILD